MNKPLMTLTWPQFIALLVAGVYAALCVAGVSLYFAYKALNAFLGFWWG